jgi:hypothetical protein
MDNKQVQVNIRIAEKSALRLKSLAESAGLKIGPFVERMIAAYSDDSNLLQNDSNPVHWQSVADELRGLIAGQDVRLNALEVALMTGLEAGGREVRVTVQPADLTLVEPVETNNDASSHQADSSPTAQESKFQYERQLDEKIVALKNNGMGIKRIQAELQIGQNRVYKALEAAGLKGK